MVQSRQYNYYLAWFKSTETLTRKTKNVFEINLDEVFWFNTPFSLEKDEIKCETNQICRLFSLFEYVYKTS